MDIYGGTAVNDIGGGLGIVTGDTVTLSGVTSAAVVAGVFGDAPSSSGPGAPSILNLTLTNNSSDVDIECADGKWVWQKNGMKYQYPFVQSRMNSSYGKDEMDLIAVRTDQGIMNHEDFKGDADDLYHIAGNTEFTPWSNPGSNHGSKYTDIAVYGGACLGHRGGIPAVPPKQS